ncbi:MAG TPA: hypothetical protein VGQ23_10020 [Burkholderiaceae bacterium]|jgi:hypothetical protein|nr:hypothetical protein [Burkholderiaceae bacterium]
MHLIIKDLSASTELDHAAMTAVRGGEQVNGGTQMTVMNQNVANAVGNGLVSGNGPISVVSDISTTQTSFQYLDQYNVKSLGWFI